MKPVYCVFICAGKKEDKDRYEDSPPAGCRKAEDMNIGAVNNAAYRPSPVMDTAKPKTYKVFMKTPDMLFSGGNGTGLSFTLKYAEGHSKDDPVVIAKGVDENGREFEQRIDVRKVDPRNATIVEMRAMEAVSGVEKQYGFTSLPLSCGDMGLNDRRDFMDSFKDAIEQQGRLGMKDTSLYYRHSMQAYQRFVERLNNEKKEKAPYDDMATDGIIEYNGVTFVCDPKNNRLCLGDVSNPDNCITIPLSKGGSLMVNRNNIGELADAIGMFSPEDQKLIMQAIGLYNRIREMKEEVADEKANATEGAGEAAAGGNAEAAVESENVEDDT